MENRHVDREKHCRVQGNVELDEILSNLVTNVDGAIAAAVGGMDGLLVEQFPADTKSPVSNLVAENANLLRSTLNAYKNVLDLGAVGEIIVQSDKIMGYLRPITAEFFLTLVMEPRGNLGKARLMSGDAIRQLKGTLS
jgi:uncharacterized protein